MAPKLGSLGRCGYYRVCNEGTARAAEVWVLLTACAPCPRGPPHRLTVATPVQPLIGASLRSPRPQCLERLDQDHPPRVARDRGRMSTLCAWTHPVRHA